MKRFTVLLVLVLGAMFSAFAQISDPVSWKFEAEKVSENEFILHVKASIDDGWHLYSQDPGEGPIPTQISIETENGVQTLGDVSEEGDFHNEYDPNFESTLNFYSHKAVFKQKVKVEDTNKPVKGYVYFMVCDDSKCLPPEYVDFSYDLNTLKGSIVLLEGGKEIGTEDNAYYRSSVDLNNPVQGCGVKAEKTEDKSLWNIFVLGFLGGLVALLTPCVFPMIPLTVSFFTKGSQDKKKGVANAMLYGFFIFMIYILLSMPFHFLDSIAPEILNTISTNVWLNLSFFVIFIVFAISFFGYFEITLPSSLTNKMDSASNVGGLIGIFFMALTLALVSFSCTGPILGSLLAGSLSTDGGAIQLTAGMGGFGLALALPFALFAAFPGWLNSLPQSGGWLNSVKVVLGFVELALAIKFLSNADLVDHWGILKIEAFLGLWIFIFVGLALYLFGKIKFPHDSPIKKLSFSRISLGTLVVAFVIYLGSGFRVNKETETFTSLKLLSGLAPSVGYSWMYPKVCPLAINCFKDYEEGLAYAKKVNKPILVDFTGYACVNCRKMEENVWPIPEIKSIITDDYVLISLYVDDKKELPEDQKELIKTKNGASKQINTYGEKWSTLQSETFGNNSQPWYCLISPDEILLTSPVGYTPDADQYKDFLECGVSAFKKTK